MQNVLTTECYFREWTVETRFRNYTTVSCGMLFSTINSLLWGNICTNTRTATSVVFLLSHTKLVKVTLKCYLSSVADETYKLIKIILVNYMKSHGGCGGIIPLILTIGTGRRFSGQLYNPAAFTCVKGPAYPLSPRIRLEALRRIKSIVHAGNWTAIPHLPRLQSSHYTH
jgi:hypothetical protein